MLDASNVSFICIFAGAGHVTDLTESTTPAESLLSGECRPTTPANRRLLLLVYLALQVKLVCLVGQFTQFTYKNTTVSILAVQIQRGNK